MQRILTLCLCLGVSLSLTAQDTRFIDEIFEVGEPELGVTYATNISILTGAPAPEELKMDVYQPDLDGESDNILRPIVCVFHTGNFLPQFINQGAYGSRTDSANVEIINRLVKRGYVAASVSYRQGWLPLADDQSIRTGTLLQAAYRGAQDAHALARFLRMTVEDMDNPYQIDTSRIVFMGMGTGGYVVNTHAFLDTNAEIGLNDQFYDDEGDTLIQAALLGNPQGTQAGQINIPNHLGYSSDVALAINVAGATGDPIWIEGKAHEPLYMGFHSLTDPFAPIYRGTVVVPTTDETVVSGVAGTNGTLELVADVGGNAELAPANAIPLPAIFPPLSTELNGISMAQQGIPVVSPIPTATMDTFPLGRANMYTHFYPRVIAGPYNWFDEATMRAIVAQLNMVLEDDINPDAIIAGEELTNPNWDDPEEAKKTIDTMIAFMLPRLWYGLELEAALGTEDLVDAATIGLSVYPNPAGEFVRVEVAQGYQIREIALIDMMGRVAGNWTGINQATFRLDRGTWPRGYYNVRLRLDEGIVTQRVLFE